MPEVPGVLIIISSRFHVPLADASTFAILAGSSVTNTGATNITGDLGLSR